MNTLLDVAGAVIAALEASGVRYSVGGSLASAFSGEPRASVDADIVVDLTAAHVRPFIERLGVDFYADDRALRRAIRTGSTAIVHASITTSTHSSRRLTSGSRPPAGYAATASTATAATSSTAVTAT